MIIKDIQSPAKENVGASQKLVHSFKMGEGKKMAKALYENALKIQKEWNKFYCTPKIKYNQGFVNFELAGYAPGWIQATGYSDGPTEY